MNFEPSSDTHSDPTSDDLRARIRSCRRGSIALGLYFVLIGLPIAGNYGKGGPPILEPSPAWAPWIQLLGFTGFLSGVCAVWLAVRVGVLEDRLPRGLRKSTHSGGPTVGRRP